MHPDDQIEADIEFLSDISTWDKIRAWYNLGWRRHFRDFLFVLSWKVGQLAGRI